jgi:hypothetical protein
MIGSVLSTSGVLPYLVISVIGHPAKLLTKGVMEKNTTTEGLPNGTYKRWSIETEKEAYSNDDSESRERGSHGS